ncbi:MAG: hypothetical protein K2X29_11675 [Candidatus Obscuribacterales bacterium]|nr:hypothetical protein [Candidatus Obscuribacterales bacterium]
MGSKGESFQHGEQHTNFQDLAEKWQKDLNEFVCGTVVNPAGRLRQAALVTEGLVFGAISDIGNHNAVEVATLAGEATVIGGVLGTLMASKYKLLKSAITLAGSVGGLVYAGSLWDKHSKDKDLTEALNTVYKSSELKSFNDQTSIANKSLGRDGFNLAVTGIAGGIGFGAAAKLAPHVAARYGSRRVNEFFVDLPRMNMTYSTTVGHSSIPEPIFGKYKSAIDETPKPATAGSGQILGHGEVKTMAKATSDAPLSNKTSSHGREGVNSEIAQRAFKQDVASWVRDMVNGKVGLRAAVDESEGYIFNRNNKIETVVVRPGASPEDVARRIMVGSSSSRIGKCDAAMQAARQGAHRTGYDAPQGGDLGIAAREGKPFHDSTIGEFRSREGAQRYAVEGSEAYYRGESGNDYTAYLRRTQGYWTAERQAEAELLMTNPTSMDSPWNTSYNQISDSLASLGIKSTTGNRAAVSNPSVIDMPSSQQYIAIKAVGQYLENHPSIAGLEGVEKQTAIWKLAQSLKSDEVNIIADVYRSSQGGDIPILNKDMMSSVDSLMKSGCVKKAGNAYRLLSQYSNGQLNKPNMEAAEKFIVSARELGMRDEQLMAEDFAEMVNFSLKDLLKNGESDLIPDLAVCMKIVGRETSLDDLCAVNALRTNNWDLNRINAEVLAMAKHLITLGKNPTKENIFNAQNKLDFKP